MAAFFLRMINYITQKGKRLKGALLNKISYDNRGNWIIDIVHNGISVPADGIVLCYTTSSIRLGSIRLGIYVWY